MNKNKGFTLIELLVVIAIIGILASVVLAALSSARSKGQDASIQSQLSSMRSQAELYYSTTGAFTYGSTTIACSGANTLFAGMNSLAKLIAGITTAKDCGASASAWSVAAQGQTNTIFYCVDHTGIIRTKNLTGNTYTGLQGTDSGSLYFTHQTIGQTTCS